MLLAFAVLRALALFTIGAHVLVEVIGYFWHRGSEHEGWLGDSIRQRHWMHHQVDYPAADLRPLQQPEYREAGSWSWYAIAVVTTAVVFWLLPLRDAVPLVAGGVLYAWLLINVFHEAVHTRDHWLNRFAWFRHLARLHDVHHFAPANYGMAFFWMDRLFGTYAVTATEVQGDLFPGYRAPIQ